MSGALVVIDVQNLMFSGKTVPTVHEPETLIENINSVIASARAKDQDVIFIQQSGPEGDFLERGSEAWELWSGLDKAEKEPVFEKTEGDSLTSVGLSSYLQENGIRDLTLIGCASEHCVTATVKGALARGYNVTVVADAHGTWGSEDTPPTQMVAQQNALFETSGATLTSTAALAA